MKRKVKFKIKDKEVTREFVHIPLRYIIAMLITLKMAYVPTAELPRAVAKSPDLNRILTFLSFPRPMKVARTSLLIQP